MFYFPDILVFCCLYVNGFFFGYYCKFTYIYDNLYIHWYSLLGVFAALTVGGLWTLRKYKKQQYRFDHLYIILYGMICSIIASCFLLTDNLDISFYFGFLGLSIIHISSFSFISLRSNSQGLRPARIAIGNVFYFGGITMGFDLFNEFQPKFCGWVYFGVTVLIIIGIFVNEILQYINVHDYKKSPDRVFDLMNDEKIIFQSTKTIYAFYVDRKEFYIKKNRQWLIVGISAIIILERNFLYSWSCLQLTWNSTSAYLDYQYLFGPFLFYTIGCLLGSLLMLRYKPKLMYLLFGLIKITLTAALLGVYSEDFAEKCFFFLCFLYITMGVYSSISLQIILECTPFLLTELLVAVAFAIELLTIEVLKYEAKADSSSKMLMGIEISSIVVTLISITLVQMFLPRSEGLIDIRNYLIGIRRYQKTVKQTNMWHNNYFSHPNLQTEQMTSVKLDGNRMFQQYPKETKTKF